MTNLPKLWAGQKLFQASPPSSMQGSDHSENENPWPYGVMWYIILTAFLSRLRLANRKRRVRACSNRKNFKKRVKFSKKFPVSIFYCVFERFFWCHLKALEKTNKTSHQTRRSVEKWAYHGPPTRGWVSRFFQKWRFSTCFWLPNLLVAIRSRKNSSFSIS